MRQPRRIFVRAQRREKLRRAVIAAAVPASCLIVGAAVLGTSGAPLEFPGRIAASPTHVAVVDGATLRVGDTTVDLAGVAAPRPEQGCAGHPACAATATRTLAAIVRDRQVECQLRTRAADGRPEGVCHAGDVEVNRAVVASGWAYARPSAPIRLVSAEQDARARHRGLWSEGK